MRRIQAHCRHLYGNGDRCEKRIPAGQRLCATHKAKSAKVQQEKRRWRKEQAYYRRREREIKAYRRRVDPGPLPI